jgi:hypothetical protein
MSTRDERRKAKKDEERRKQEELDKLLEEPKPPAFEAPARGRIVDSRRKPDTETNKDSDKDGDGDEG